MQRRLRWVFALAVLTAVAILAFRNRQELVEAFGAIGRISPLYLAAAAAAVCGVYFSRGCAYRIALCVMGYSFGRWFLARTALVATAAHHLLPSGGASGYAFITYSFHQRGVAAGRASVLALVDTLSNAAALGSLVVIVLAYLATGASRAGAGLGPGLVPAFALLALAVSFYYLQRDRGRLERFAGAWKARLGRLLRRQWPDAPLRRFLDEYYEGKHLIARRPKRFALMVGWQYVATLCNCLALYVVFFALGVVPSPWVLFVGLVLALAGVAAVGVPGGGGSFEVVMSSYFATHGIAPADSIAAALMYRLVAFWLPVLASALVLLRLRHQERAL